MYAGNRDVDIAIEQPPPRCSGDGSSAAWWVLGFFCLIFIIFGCYAGYSQDNRDNISMRCQQFAEKVKEHTQRAFRKKASKGDAPTDEDDKESAVNLAEVKGQTDSGHTVNTSTAYSNASDPLKNMHPATCPKCSGPLAYGQATADRT